MLILDESLLSPVSTEQTREILENIEAHSVKSSVIFCTQFEPQGWYSRIRIDCDATICEASIPSAKHRWLILANQSNIRYRSDPRMDSHFHALMNTYDYEDDLFRIDPNLKDFRDLQKMYVQFNSRNGENSLLARNELKEYILTYKSFRFETFRDFASLLEKFEYPIVNSFIMVEKT